VDTHREPGRRILVYGVTGSGKSTLARAIAVRLGLTYHDVDALAWEPGWVMTSKESQRRAIETICAGDRWVLDAAYSSWGDIPGARADLIVGLDYPRALSLGRLLRRTARRMRTRETICNGNVESVRGVFARDSIVVWHFKSFRRKRDRMRAWYAAQTPAQPVLLFTHPREAEKWLTGLPDAAQANGSVTSAT
jgi:adenylate kinase family enzyme